MKAFLFSLSLASLSILSITQSSSAEGDAFSSQSDVIWTSLGTNENDSMPIGNGDLAANVWTEQNGDLVLLVAKSDAWTELGKLVKLGRLRIQLKPNPFVGQTDFTQVLKLENGSITIKSGADVMTVWVDANHPAIHVAVKLDHPAIMRANLELWRTAEPDTGGMFELGGSIPIEFAADTVFPAGTDQIAWCHFNPSSVYPFVLEQEHLGSIAQKYPDPLFHRCFGAAISGPGLTNTDDKTLKSALQQDFRLDLVALTETQAASPQAFENDLNILTKETTGINPKRDWDAHQKWWSDFWNRSWMHVTGSDDANEVSQGYIMQRYMMACSSRGAYPVKFNGGLFTVGHDLSGHRDSNDRHHDPDYRAWGNSYWNQNNRLLYWPLIETGDFDLLTPWFGMYLSDLPLAEARTRLYYNHGGASFPETMLFWGLPNLNDFGWNNPTTEIQSHWQRYHIQGTLEVISQMLDEYDITRNADFVRMKIIPFADAIVTYYSEHWPRDAQGKIRMAPTQSLETYQMNAVNPTPDIAGLKSILPRLLNLPRGLASRGQRERWGKALADLPPLPLGKTAHGKMADSGKGEPDGATIILPAEKYGRPDNGENPELYVAFPYRLYGVGKPDLKLALDTFAARRFPQDTCWGQDGTQSSILGLTDVAKRAAIAEFTDYGDQRFSWFWKAGHDWIPDLDNGGSGMITLQNMLIQCDGKRIQLLPAWPDDWTVDFKLHAPYKTVVEGQAKNGRITRLRVTPLSRAKDVIIVDAQD